MRAVFALRLGERTHQQTELVEGRIHRRRIALAPTTNRIFQTSHKVRARGLSIALVLDESGSMGHVRRTLPKLEKGYKAEVVAHLAVLMAEALKGQPGIELEIYSYASCGRNQADCLIKYLYGKKNPYLQAIGDYGDGMQNYDHIALKKCGEMFIANTTNKNRLMIVLNDGAPCGYDYGGPETITATEKSVQELERKGIHVLNVAIESFCSEQMFKHVIRFLDLPELINQMRRLVTGIIKHTVD
jgi:nitric oxide reductase activation protein